jgi:hypothetical protein
VLKSDLIVIAEHHESPARVRAEILGGQRGLDLVHTYELLDDALQLVLDLP